MTTERIPVAAIVEVRRLLRAELPALLTTHGLSAAVIPKEDAIFIGSPSLFKEDDGGPSPSASYWPRVCINGEYRGRQLGTTLEPQLTCYIYAAFKWAGTEDAYMDGLTIASYIEYILRNTNDNPPHWEDVLISPMSLTTAEEPKVWQGGCATVVLLGVNIAY